MTVDTEKQTDRGLRIVVIGGGTGSFTLLSGLKQYTSQLTSLVNMVDDGGSTGVLRDELGALPPGDVRQCLVALSSSPRMRDLFNYRFEDGALAGHAFGNLFLTALEKMTGNFGQAVEEASRILAINGRVEPITLDDVRLVLKTSSGKVTHGQFEGTKSDFGAEIRPEVSLTPSAKINPRAKEALAGADMVVIAPGGLYTSLAPALIVEGVSEALKDLAVPVLYVCNLITKPGQTDNFRVSDYVDEIERFMDGAKVDYVLYNTRRPSARLLKRYAHEAEFPVQFQEADFVKKTYKAFGRDLLARRVATSQSKADPLRTVRSFIRHDSDRVAMEIINVYRQHVKNLAIDIK